MTRSIDKIELITFAGLRLVDHRYWMRLYSEIPRSRSRSIESSN